MSMLLSFAPFILFGLLDNLLGVAPALGASAVMSAFFVLRDWLTPKRTVKLLDVGTVLLFGGLALYALDAHTQWSLLSVRLRVDAGLLILALASMVLRQPFTLQYAREQASAAAQEHPVFMKINYVLTSVWAAAFGLMVVADLVMTSWAAIPKWVGVAVMVLAITGAIRFTLMYPQRAMARSRAQQ